MFHKYDWIKLSKVLRYVLICKFVCVGFRKCLEMLKDQTIRYWAMVPTYKLSLQNAKTSVAETFITEKCLNTIELVHWLNKCQSFYLYGIVIELNDSLRLAKWLHTKCQVSVNLMRKGAWIFRRGGKIAGLFVQITNNHLNMTWNSVSCDRV